MNFCPDCAAPVILRVPEGDHRPRYICTHCGHVHYQNPRIVAGVVAEWHGSILLCRRAIEPRRGFWTIPAGFLENGESVPAGALRETAEEALAEVELGSLLAVISVLHSQQVHMMFRARLCDGRHGAGEESLEARLYDEADIPWPEIAFTSVRFALERYFEDRRAGREGLHFHDISQRAPGG
jgi:ADP-ribose pyrophosphatase YjhB (NUDIX family)